MLTAAGSRDPRYLRFRQHLPNDPLHYHNNCVSFAAADDETVYSFADRAHEKIRQPDLGDAAGIPLKIVQFAYGCSVQHVLKAAVASGMKPLECPAYGKLPEVPAGYRRIAMFYLDGGPKSQYHFQAEGVDGLWIEKDCDALPTDKDKRLKLMTDPRQAFIPGYPEGPWLFAIPERGLDMRMRPEWKPIICGIADQTELAKKAGSPINSELADLIIEAAKLSTAHDRRLSERLAQIAHFHRTGQRPFMTTTMRNA